jgi:hypothetical protein
MRLLITGVPPCTRKTTFAHGLADKKGSIACLTEHASRSPEHVIAAARDGEAMVLDWGIPVQVRVSQLRRVGSAR